MTTEPGPPASGVAVDWPALRAEAVRMTTLAYAPYSHFAVGVAGLVDDGRMVSGCNVENAAYGVTLCAECGMVSSLHATGGGLLVAVWCDAQNGDTLMPCGRCRQLLWENGTPSTQIQTPEGLLTLRDVLPQAFGRDTLDAVAPVD